MNKAEICSCTEPIATIIIGSKQVGSVKFISWSIYKDTLTNKRSVTGCIQFDKLDTEPLRHANDFNKMEDLVPAMTVVFDKEEAKSTEEGCLKAIAFRGLKIMYCGHGVTIDDFETDYIYTFVADEMIPLSSEELDVSKILEVTDAEHKENESC